MKTATKKMRQRAEAISATQRKLGERITFCSQVNFRAGAEIGVINKTVTQDKSGQMTNENTSHA